MKKERWKDIPGYEKRYAASTLGRIKNIKTDKILKPFDRAVNNPKISNIYLTVYLTDGAGKYKNWTVHSLVMLTYKGPRPEGMVIHHKDWDTLNNSLGNLKYCTQSYNRKEDFRCGIQSLRGEKNTQAILKEKDVLKIVNERKKSKTSYKDLAKRFGVSVSGIANIFNGHTWSYLTKIK